MQKHLILIGVLLWPILGFGQSVTNYSVLRTTGINYTSIIPTGNSFAAWRSTGTFSVDDNRSEATDIGFDFWYNGIRYTQFSVSTNGFMDFSNSADDGGPQCDDYGYCNENFSASSLNLGTWNALAPFYDDMTTRSGADPLGTSIKYELSGTAPNRVLTVEWDAMAVYQNTTPDINFQVKVYETTGTIEYWYETMDNGTNTFSYTIGINASSVSNPPLSSELLTQQLANTATFGSTPQNNLSTMPMANSQLRFIPPVPANPSGVLNFSNITNTGITLNWSDWASNEVGYAIYYSTDNVNFFYDSQTNANATTASVTGLVPNTTYYWKIMAVTEGALSNPLTGNATTLAPTTITSIATGRWDRSTTWDCGCIPTAGDNVIINDGHTVTIRVSNLACNDLTVGQGTSGKLRYTRSTGRDLTVNGNLLINAGAQLFVKSNSNTTHTLNSKGNITNLGTIDLATDTNSLCDLNFTKQDGNQTVSGTGATNFYTLGMDKGAKSNTVEITSSNFTCDADALSFTSGGTFKFSSTGTNDFSLFSVAKEIPINGAIWMNSGNSIMRFGNDVIVSGDLRVDAGSVIVGDAADENLLSNGGLVSINGGSLQVAGRYSKNSNESTSNFTQTAGVLTLPNNGSTSTTESPFSMDVTGSTQTISGGSIVIQQAGGTNLGYSSAGVTNANITGGTLQIGNASTPVAQTIQVNATNPISNFLVSNTNATAKLTGPLYVITNITLSAGSLVDNSNDISLNGDWLANGGVYNASSVSTVTLNGNNQSITTGGSAFNHLFLNGSGITTLQDDLTINGDLSFTTTLTPANNGFNLTVGGNFTNNGVLTRANETLVFNGITNQDIAGTSTNDFTNITINKSGGMVTNNSTINLYQALEITSSTTLDVNGGGSGSFNLLSSATEESRVGVLASGASIIGTVRAEKYLPVYGAKRWRNISFPVINATVADIQNEVPISGNFTGSDNGTGSIPAYATGSLAYYDNTIGDNTQTLDDRWVLYPTTDNNALVTTSGTEARGYALWIRDLGAVTFDVTGSLNQGTIDFKPSGTHERWNLMGNPYPSAINWDAAGWTKTGIQGNAIYVWDGLQYRTWNGSLGDMGDGIIAKGQAFWVQGSQANMALVATEAIKSTNRGATFKTSNTASYLELSISDSTYTDKTFIYFSEGASPEYDSQDASKLLNYIFSLSSLSADSAKLAINAISPDSLCNLQIPLMMEYIWEGTFNFGWRNLESIPAYLSVTLMDTYTTTEYNIGEVNSFHFNITSDEASKNPFRFYITITTKPLTKNEEVSVAQICNTNQAVVSIVNSEQDVTYQLLNEMDEIVANAVGNGTTLELMLDSAHLKTGSNNFKLAANAGICEHSILDTLQIQPIEQPLLTFDSVASRLITSCQPNLKWYKNDVQVTTNLDSVLVIDTQPAIYKVQVSNESCVLTSKPFEVKAPQENELITGISKEELEQLGLQAYPNPFVDKLWLTLPNPGSITSLKLVTTTGLVVWQMKTIKEKLEIDTSNLSSGLYFLQITTRGNISSYKLIK